MSSFCLSVAPSHQPLCCYTCFLWLQYSGLTVQHWSYQFLLRWGKIFLQFALPPRDNYLDDMWICLGKNKYFHNFVDVAPALAHRPQRSHPSLAANASTRTRLQLPPQYSRVSCCDWQGKLIKSCIHTIQTCRTLNVFTRAYLQRIWYWLRIAEMRRRNIMIIAMHIITLIMNYNYDNYMFINYDISNWSFCICICNNYEECQQVIR